LSGNDSRAKQQGKRYGNPDSNLTHGKRTASKNHLESPSPINGRRTEKYVLVELQARRITAPSTDGPTPEHFFWISYRRFLDTEWEGRTRRIKKQRSESACRGVDRFWAVGSEYTLCNKAKQRGFEDEARKRIRHSHAQCKNNQGVLGIVPGLNRVIPVVKQLD
jgi:hypothetical protein